MDILRLIGRQKLLFNNDIYARNKVLSEIVENNRFLVIGGAGSIGQAVSREIFKRNPKQLHIVDISENNLVELVRDLRSTIGYTDGEFKTYAIDCGSDQLDAIFEANAGYDFVLNLSALKHVRSEKDPFTLMRMIEVNIFNSIKISRLAQTYSAKKYFCVSTDKAANPVNMMGASKRIMELFLADESKYLPISMARFANVAFSDGSLLHGFNQRFIKKQPISAPSDVLRYFLTPQESGELCLLSCIFGENLDIYFPKLSEELHLVDFATIAKGFLDQLGYGVLECETEEEARSCTEKMIKRNIWPCYFFKSDTTGEKDFEEFFTEGEKLDLCTYEGIGVVKQSLKVDSDKLLKFRERIATLRSNNQYEKRDLVGAFLSLVENFEHHETGRYLDDRM